MIKCITVYFLQICLFTIIILTSSCTTEESKTSDLPSDWLAEIALANAIDINSNSKIVEINLEADEISLELKPGIFTNMWVYNGTFPGPTINANVGDTLVVNFTNNLSRSTTVHWHGLELPANMDGSHIAQLPIAANGGTFRYEFKLTRAATYWYHPHLQSNIQVEMGMYGALIVRDPAKDKALGLPTDEVVIILDDILLDVHGQIEPPSDQQVPLDPIENATVQLNGREGNAFLVNGKLLPIDSFGEELKSIKAHSGKPIRFRFINAANARFFRFAMEDHNFYKIGGDGGLLASTITAEPIDVVDTTNNTLKLQKIRPRDGAPLQLVSNPDLNKGIMLVPGERTDFVVTPIGNSATELYLEWHFFPRGFHGVEYNDANQLIINHNHTPSPSFPIKILKFEFTKNSDIDADTFLPPANLQPVAEIITDSNTPVLKVTFGHSFPDENGNINFFATRDSNNNGVPFDQVTDELALNVTIGNTYIWEVTNLTQGDHPFHPHGFTFQYISTEFIDAENNSIEYATSIETKDTIRIPARRGILGKSRTIVRLAVTFSDSNREGQVTAFGKTPTQNTSGGWFVHCHILEHSSRGMGTYINLK